MDGGTGGREQTEQRGSGGCRAEKERKREVKLRSETFKGWWGEVGRMAEAGKGWMIATSRVEVESWAETDTTGRKKRVLREETKERRRP